MGGIRGQHVGGGKAKSLAVHRARSTYRPDRHGHLTVAPPLAVPSVTLPARAPAGLSASSRLLWKKLIAHARSIRQRSWSCLSDGAAQPRRCRASPRDAQRRRADDARQVRQAAGTSGGRDFSRRASRVRECVENFGISGSGLMGSSHTPIRKRTTGARSLASFTIPSGCAFRPAGHRISRGKHQV